VMNLSPISAHLLLRHGAAASHRAPNADAGAASGGGFREAMACSAILVLDLKGRVLLARDYRGDIPLKQADRFIQKVPLIARSFSNADLACG
jgi:hypothetical protein